MCACTYLCVLVSVWRDVGLSVHGCIDGCTMPSESGTPIGREVLAVAHCNCNLWLLVTLARLGREM